MTTLPAPRTTPDLHHASHRHLLDDLAPQSAGRLDAIIVPTFRAAYALRDALALARDLGRPLVALCSGQAQARHAVALAQAFDARIVAVDLHDVRPKLPSFATDEVVGTAGFAAVSDLSLKRNLGLLIARAAGWDRVLFLDDDICGVLPDELAGAAEHLNTGRYRAVGLNNTGFADNSVVCHAYRAVGADQDTFIGGGAMIINPLATRSFFPNIYNEDWFFLLGDGVPFRAARSGTMVQRSYNPFATPRRATNEELGDTLAEGLYWMLDFGQDPAAGSPAFWGDFVFRRRALLDHVLSEVDTHVTDAARAFSIKGSLRAAKGASAFITPYLCHEFVQAWTDDLRTWSDLLDRFARVNTIEKAFAELGLGHVWSQSFEDAPSL
ncbi:hypothetical protein [Paractinoplanes toevensis]|uniref:Glycosyltransferase n=1 Tax=Paractinoplanes toevensis TaxID=571911 RepID=A0A919TFE8_9ACTN|nr:hypothetical protein [Actinoplanes toevensis]GIM94137.1 hypothetical protein Ato02nite_059300 [Actinoplanes toevensis]